MAEKPQAKTTEELNTAMVADPETYWNEQHKLNMRAISGLLEKAQEQLTKGSQYFLGALAGMVSYQSEELTLWHILETSVRNGTAEESDLRNCLTKLDALRGRKQEILKAQGANAPAGTA